ncbi:MAG TPA: sulfotransferase domain-containing protein, partial [Gaiellales bacterium]|nr:sulfotransferase domain-containing protein [Gaiellales bacterium]
MTGTTATDLRQPIRRAHAFGRTLVGRARRSAGGADAAGTRAVLIVGAQRSGTTMLLEVMGRLPGVEIYGESDPRAFESFRIRSPEVIRSIVASSRTRAVVFKPLCDSHRTASLLDELGTPPRPRAVWVYRAPDDRVRSSVAKFGDSNRRALRRIAQDGDLTGWQAGGLSGERLALIQSFDYDRLSPESAAGLFWYVRNSLYFDLGLDQRPDVTLCSYDAFVAAPEASMQALCRFLELEYE